MPAHSPYRQTHTSSFSCRRSSLTSFGFRGWRRKVTKVGRFRAQPNLPSRSARGGAHDRSPSPRWAATGAILNDQIVCVMPESRHVYGSTLSAPFGASEESWVDSLPPWRDLHIARAGARSQSCYGAGLPMKYRLLRTPTDGPRIVAIPGKKTTRSDSSWLAGTRHPGASSSGNSGTGQTNFGSF
jgi:hypothetical protein